MCVVSLLSWTNATAKFSPSGCVVLPIISGSKSKTGKTKGSATADALCKRRRLQLFLD
jgi:hypothetical protein